MHRHPIDRATRIVMVAIMGLLGMIAAVGLAAACTGSGAYGADEPSDEAGREAAIAQELERSEKIRMAAVHYAECLERRLPLRLDNARAGAAAGYDAGAIEEVILAGDLTRPEMTKVLYSLACDGLPRDYWYED